MKNQIVSIALCAIGLSGCDPQALEGVLSKLPTTQTGTVSNDDIIQGLKEALRLGAQAAVKSTSNENGFLNDPLIRIPFPPEAQQAKEWALSKGLTNQVNTFETTLNRAAEKASSQAFDIFANAIVQMSMNDAYQILHGPKNAATEYLKGSTTSQLKTSFGPIVARSIQEVELTKYWEPITTGYNATTLLTGKPKVNTDLQAYVLDLALSGLFIHVAKEEEKIRVNPAARVNEILQKVFGSLDQ
jgi:Protein of unknown function (DUF4197)